MSEIHLALFYQSMTLNTLPEVKILDWSKLRVFADDKIMSAKMMIFVSDRVENIVEKGNKCWFPAFSPFPTMFSKGFLIQVVQIRDCASGKELNKL